MKQFAALTGLLVLLGSLGLADTVTGSGAFVPFPTLGDGTAFWDNASRDGPSSCGTNSVCSGMNVGYFLTDTGNFPANCNNFGTNPACGTNYLGAGAEYYAQSSNTPNAPNNFGFLSSTIAVQLSLLGGFAAKNANNNNPYAGSIPNSFGYYDASQTTVGGASGSEVPIYSSGSIESSFGNSQSFVPAYSDYGFYVTVCQSTILVGTTYNCTATSTYFTNASLDPGSESSHQHFALFTLGSNPTTFFIGVEDGLNNDPIESNGDFNDVIVRLITSSPNTPLPEPATFSLMGAGLAAILIVRRRRAR